ncbi:MAG: aspartate kinase, partial [Saprospiraceae bacterium]
MKVLKFGGTSVGSVDSIKTVISILEDNLAKGERIAVVFSAMGGVTNRLIEIGKMAAAGNTEYIEFLKVVEERHFSVVRGLIPVKNQSSTFAAVRGIFNELEDILKGVSWIKELSERTLDLIMSFGERLSTMVITEILKSKGINAEFCDARQIIHTNATYGMGDVNFEITNHQILEYFAKTSALQCVTGFIASTAEGITTTLGRGGSDYTASILAAALEADSIEIWTDVDGMMTADPRKVANAFTIPSISYAEAMELSHFGAKVIYPPSLQPAFAKNITLKVLNTFNVDFGGTYVQKSANGKEYAITGISSIDEIALVNIQGSGMI